MNSFGRRLFRQLMWPSPRWSRGAYAWLLLSLLIGPLGIVGCSREKLEQLAADAQKATQQAVTNVAPRVEKIISNQPDGEATLQFQGDVRCDSVYGQLLILGGGRPNILRIRSYQTPEQERFPAFLFQAAVGAQSLEELTNSTVQGQMFLQTSAAASPCSTLANNPLSLRLEAVENGEVPAEIVGGELQDVAGKRHPLQGKLRISNLTLASESSASPNPAAGVAR